MHTPFRRPTAVRRWSPTQAVIGLVLAAEVLYLAIANPILASERGRRWFNAHPRLKIGYASAWTPLPGLVSVRGLDLDYSNAAFAWTAKADRASGWIVLPELLFRRFHLAGLRGGDVTFEYARHTAAGQVPKAKRVPPRRAPWRIRLSQARIERLTSLIANDFEFEGSATAAGGFDVRLDGRAEVHRSVFHVERGRFALGGGDLLRDAAGSFRMRIEPFNYRQFRGLAVLPFASGSVDATAQASAADLLAYFLRDLDWLHWSGERSVLTANMKLDHGQLVRGSRARFAPQEMAASYLDYTVAGTAGVAWSVADGDQQQLASRIAADFSEYRVRRGKDSEPHLFGEKLQVRASGDRLGLFEAFSGLRMRVDMPDANVPDLKVYDAYLPAPAGVTILRGSGTLSAWLDMDASAGTGTGEMVFAAPAVAASYSGTTMTGDIALRTPLNTMDFAAGSFDISGTELRLSGVCMADCGADRATDWWGRFELEQGVLQPGKADAVTATVRAELRDSRPLVLLFSARRDLPGWVQGLLDVQNVGARAQLTAGRGRVELRDLVGQGEKLELRARMDLRPEQRTGQIYARYGLFKLGLDLVPGGRDLRLRHPLEWYEAGAPGGGSTRAGTQAPAPRR